MKRIAILALGCLISMNSFAQAIYTDAAKPITVSKTENTFTISLKANPTTGYVWFLKNFNNKLLEIESHKYQPPKSNAMGAPGKDIWTFKVDSDAFDAPQMAELTFVYTKPWDLKDQQQTVFTVLTTDQ